MSNDMPSVYRCDLRKARSQHTCCECRGTIRKGETYNYHHGIWSGEAQAYKVCFPPPQPSFAGEIREQERNRKP